MGNLLGVAQTQESGAPRSFAAKVIDPAGVCIQAADIKPFDAPEDLVVEPNEKQMDVDEPVDMMAGDARVVSD
eukprot:CAMPEP_0198736706 /NCGR_PEP_ID=MMETSP1475-20131203/67493_1 /TAXON_ID= ORGANISM="Unidentified sp., Strain CCMP1999" /NCGR_SAMPLE_ID=MMETSP1475 /ASSEMBLY_ACC=CAM_ASM_001111 /LENGTH=72 /DNA_ID=CAMNT_0044500555 /DNA_START=51 /DNA_END=269 /DNA_ORIENTATION=+